MRKTRLQKAFTTLTGDHRPRGAVMWFIKQLRDHKCGQSKSVVYRWFDGEHVENGDLLEGVLRTLEGDAMLARVERVEAEAKAIREGLKS